MAFLSSLLILLPSLIGRHCFEFLKIRYQLRGYWGIPDYELSKNLHAVPKSPAEFTIALEPLNILKVGWLRIILIHESEFLKTHKSHMDNLNAGGTTNLQAVRHFQQKEIP